MAKDRWLAPITSEDGNHRVLYAVAHAGAGVAATKQACRELTGTIDTVGVRLPGRESRLSETPLTELDEITEALAVSIELEAGQREIHLYGHCSGAVIAYEVALRLPPGRVAGLVVSAQEAPHRLPLQGAWRLPRQQFLEQVAADGYLPASLLEDPEMLDMLEPALRADYEAVESHRPSSRVLDVPILALLGVDEHAVAEADIQAWQELTSAGFTLLRLPGGHNLLQDQPAAVAQAISSWLPPA
jgi:medium-chain acyl-[acyl-carrier-protein] hydrolase